MKDRIPLEKNGGVFEIYFEDVIARFQDYSSNMQDNPMNMRIISEPPWKYPIIAHDSYLYKGVNP